MVDWLTAKHTKDAKNGFNWVWPRKGTKKRAAKDDPDSWGLPALVRRPGGFGVRGQDRAFGLGDMSPSPKR